MNKELLNKANNLMHDIETIEKVIDERENSHHWITVIAPNHNNFVIDITKCPLTVEEIRGQITDVYRSSHTKFIDKIILSKDGNILNIYKRSKKEE